MAQIDPKLLDKLSRKLGVGKQHLYKIIAKIANETVLDRRLAAIELARRHHINVQRFASAEDLAEIRRSTTREALPVPHTSIPEVAPHSREAKKRKAKKPKSDSKRRGNTVLVVHGRNEKARTGLFRFLRCLGLNPLEWTKALARTKKGSPYVGEVLDAAFRQAVAVIVLLTPDDEGRLRRRFRKSNDPRHETNLTGQARANVLFEAGMAFGKNPDSTVLVQMGDVRPFSDIGGRHVVLLDNTTERRWELITKLANAGCNVDPEGTDWTNEGDFSLD